MFSKKEKKSCGRGFRRKGGKGALGKCHLITNIKEKERGRDVGYEAMGGGRTELPSWLSYQRRYWKG